jgi:hypothetical protein
VSVAPFAFGGANWKPLAGDWDGNGTTTIGVFSPAGVWYLRNSNAAGGPDVPAFAYGAGTWQPVVGDWDGNGTTTVGVFDPAGKWYLRNSNSGGAPSIAPFAYGAGTWKPLAGDWDFPNTAVPALGPVLSADGRTAVLPPATAVTSATATPGRDPVHLNPALRALLASPGGDDPGAGAADQDLGGAAGQVGGLTPEPAAVAVPAGGWSRSSAALAEAASWLADLEGAGARHRRDLDDLFAAGW